MCLEEKVGKRTDAEVQREMNDSESWLTPILGLFPRVAGVLSRKGGYSMENPSLGSPQPPSWQHRPDTANFSLF